LTRGERSSGWWITFVGRGSPGARAAVDGGIGGGLRVNGDKTSVECGVRSAE